MKNLQSIFYFWALQIKDMILLITCLLLPSLTVQSDFKRYGNLLGSFRNHFHGVSGQVYAIDSRTLFVENFSYDGVGPDAFFYGGYDPEPSKEGFIIPDERGSKDVLRSYESKDIILTLPTGKNLRHLKWVSVWCRAFEVNFGDIIFDGPIRYPKPVSIQPLKGIHKVKSNKIVIVDAQTLLIPNFSYDGSAPDAHFWVGSSPKPGAQGNVLLDENGSDKPLGAYDKKTIVLVLPGNQTVYDIRWFSIWCVAFFVDFGSIPIPQGIRVPPSLRMLGIEPQSKLNCEVLDANSGLEVRWAIAGDNIVVQLVGKLNNEEYFGFGISKDPNRSLMIGADVCVAWMNSEEGKGYAVDYYLSDKSQCAGNKGACPDTALNGGRRRNRGNDVTLLNSAIINDYSMFTYRLKLRATDKFDEDILVNRSQAVVWATGPINSKGEVSYHNNRLDGDLLLDFGRPPKWNCPLSSSEKKSSPFRRDPQATKPSSKPMSSVPWTISPISCKKKKNSEDDRLFFAQIGPTGGDAGYASITGHVGWGISWYINGFLIPELHVVRGQTYTFIVEGGKDANFPAKYHPFYITDDPEGGYQYKTPEQRSRIQIFAGVDLNASGEAFPSGTGRLCEWIEKSSNSIDYSTFAAYKKSLELNCQDGQPGIIRWTPDENTPDLVYYQCFTHRYLGWKIHVHDRCP